MNALLGYIRQPIWYSVIRDFTGQAFLRISKRRSGTSTLRQAGGNGLQASTATSFAPSVTSTCADQSGRSELAPRLVKKFQRQLRAATGKSSPPPGRADKADVRSWLSGHSAMSERGRYGEMADIERQTLQRSKA